MTTPSALNSQFGIDDQLLFRSGAGGLTVAEINNSHAQAAVALHGAHVLSFQPHGQQPALWLSEHSHYQVGKAIRAASRFVGPGLPCIRVTLKSPTTVWLEPPRGQFPAARRYPTAQHSCSWSCKTRLKPELSGLILSGLNSSLPWGRSCRLI